MDNARFDAWTRALATGMHRASRRAALRLLVGGTLLPVLQRLDDPALSAKQKHHNRKGKRSQPKPKPRQREKQDRSSSSSPLERCTADAVTLVERAFAACEPNCNDPDAHACQSCREPGVAAGIAAAEACASGHLRAAAAGPKGRRGKASGGQRVLQTEATGCSTEQLRSDILRASNELRACLAGSRNAREIVACVARFRVTVIRAIEALGCPNGGTCIDNVCCPRPDDSVCDGVCCNTAQCETCVDGVCAGCTSPLSCGSTPAGDRACLCSGGDLTPCGSACCDSRAPNCEICVDGVCQPKCQAPKICVGASSPICQCPTGLTECGSACRDTTSDAAHCGSCGHACPSGEACIASRCETTCPIDTKPCGDTCIPKRCEGDSSCCGAKCCAPNEICSFFNNPAGQCDLACPPPYARYCGSPGTPSAACLLPHEATLCPIPRGGFCDC